MLPECGVYNFAGIDDNKNYVDVNSKSKVVNNNPNIIYKRANLNEPSSIYI